MSVPDDEIYVSFYSTRPEISGNDIVDEIEDQIKHLITILVEFNEKAIDLDDIVESLLEHLDQVEGVTDFDLWKTEERKDGE